MTVQPVDVEPIDQAKRALTRLKAWMTSSVEPIARTAHREQWNRWQAESASIQSLLEQPQSVRVALVGTTGAGKSTLLNALLGVQLLQVGVNQSITSFVTLVRHALGPGYKVKIQYETLQEWTDEVDRFLKAAAPGDDGGDGEAKSILNNLRKRVEAVHAVSLDDPSRYPRLHDLPVAPEVARIFQGQPVVESSFAETKGMVDFLRSVVRADSAVWPLVKQVTIEGPFEALRGGIELADLPGTNDFNDARVDVTRDFIRNTPYVWLVFSMKRGITKDGAEILEREKVLRTLVLSGSFNSLQLIGTHADDVDWDVAGGLGLDPDLHTDIDLIRAYRRSFVETSRPVLLQMVDNLSSSSDDGSTQARMREMAQRAPIHAVSARAFNNMTGIVRSNQHFGLEDVEDTGIPGVVRALREIGDEVGGGLTGRTVIQRIEHLKSEITSFFRARATAGNPAAARAKASLEKEVNLLSQRATEALGRARTQLESERRKFLDRIDPMLKSSVQGVTRTASAWQHIHWGTLRAIVNRNGVFKSPSSGLHDLNEQVVDPLLNQLPLAWEGYFTTELGAVRDRLTHRLEDLAADYVGRARQLSQDLGGASHDVLDRQLETFRRRLAFERQQCELKVAERIGEIRRQAAGGMTHTAKNHMMTAYELASDESGSGMKARMLGHLQPAARAAAPPIFDTIRHDLVERLTELESLLLSLFESLSGGCIAQARQVAENVNMDIDDARVPADIKTLLADVPA
jgi:GTPase SAR1 family protein